MKAAQWDPSQQKVVVNELPKPTPSDGQFLIKLASASLCHSDLMSMAMPHTEPVTIGHEGAGYIAEIHPSAESRGFKVGDAVGFTYIVNYCDECEGCAVHNNHCLTRESRVQGFNEPGLFAEYATVDASSCILLPKELPAETSAPMFCGGITGAYSPSSRKHDFGPQLTVLCI
jgi:D-arabinose 1-dehydrogenase-like Zn-dependent alcohol dehydrogenase